jgi:isopenicillin N synthase-like dioxygenase
MSAAIPVIDLGPYLAGAPGARERTAAEVGAALETIGFYFIGNHGVAPSLVERAFDACARFHAQPIEEKMRVKMVSRALIGYLPLGGQTQRTSVYGTSSHPDRSASFYMKAEFAPDHPDRVAKKPWVFDNLWPPNLPGFRETLIEYFNTMDALGRTLLPLQSIALGLGPDYFVDHEAFSPISSTLRLLMYPPRDPALHGQYGIGPHTDYGHMTILAQSKQPGLELLFDGEWVQAPALEGHFLVNHGDMFRRWSNDRVHSTPHRVIVSGTETRYSIPHFFGTRPDVRLDCLPSCTSAADPPRYPAKSFGEFIGEINRRNIDLPAAE